jgi:hypothetical protein
LELGLQYQNSGVECENKGKIEQAFKFYKEAANKFVYLLNGVGGTNPQKMKYYQELLRKALD